MTPPPPLHGVSMNYSVFFSKATGGNAPYAYQARLAASDFGSGVISIPTGLGKTAAVVIAWLYNRIHRGDSQWPRRLVYCLPMRTLVEQTRDCAEEWIATLKKAGLLDEPPDVCILMGGEKSDDDWDLHPEKPAIIVGTQDMLLSRALNRGYDMSRARWPMHFALLNNDCLWVLDEVQLMGVGVETSAQLEGMRRTLSAGGPELPRPNSGCATWWMSATLEEQRLATIDHPEPEKGRSRIELDADDRSAPSVRERLEAKKPVAAAGVTLSRQTRTRETYDRDLAAFVRDKHVKDQLTLVIVNQVARAQKVFVALRKLKPEARLALVHSRFRAGDRAKQQAELLKSGDRIVVSTQAIEAGVDVSARVLVTELAPWSSLVQRFGRCNRAGEFADGVGVYWVDVASDAGEEETRPYQAEELGIAREELKALPDVGLVSLAPIHVAEMQVIRPVVRKKDLLDLFDTTPDLAGNDLDISRYVRDGNDTDVQVFWREVPEGDRPADDTPAPARDEICRVSLPQFAEFLKEAIKKAKGDAQGPTAWAWDQLNGEWQKARTARPGGTYLLDCRLGGYDATLGWKGKGEWAHSLATNAPGDGVEGYGSNASTYGGRWLTLAEHTFHVESEIRDILTALQLDLPFLETAARWHDIGKAHVVFQEMLTQGHEERQGEIWAKSAETNGWPSRRFFRHELASALAWLTNAAPEEVERDLIAYLIAAHHGKVRLSIRPMPEEAPPKGSRPETRIARGVADGDKIPALGIGDSLRVKETTIDLSLIEMGVGPGGPSWLARMLALRDRFGPFQLAYFETLLRAADQRASIREREATAAADA